MNFSKKFEKQINIAKAFLCGCKNVGCNIVVGSMIFIGTKIKCNGKCKILNTLTIALSTIGGELISQVIQKKYITNEDINNMCDESLIQIDNLYKFLQNLKKPKES